MQLPDILVTHFGWTEQLRPRTGKNAGRFTAGQLGAFSIAPNIGRGSDRERYAVSLLDLFRPGTVWSAAGLEIQTFRGQQAVLERPLIAWAPDPQGTQGVMFLAADITPVVISVRDVCADLYRWVLLKPNSETAASQWIVQHFSCEELNQGHVDLETFRAAMKDARTEQNTRLESAGWAAMLAPALRPTLRQGGTKGFSEQSLVQALLDVALITAERAEVSSNWQAAIRRARRPG